MARMLGTSGIGEWPFLLLPLMWKLLKGRVQCLDLGRRPVASHCSLAGLGGKWAEVLIKLFAPASLHPWKPVSSLLLPGTTTLGIESTHQA